MKFREATDALCGKVDHAELAEKLGVSLATVRQSRLQPSAKAHRSPPDNWKEAVVELAEERIRRYQRLVNALDPGRGLPLFSTPPDASRIRKRRSRAGQAERIRS